MAGPIIMMRRKKSIAWRYAPLWATMIGGGTALAKRVGERFMIKGGDMKLRKSDALVAVSAATLAYASFRLAHGRKKSRWYER